MELATKHRGVIAILLASALWGVEPILGKYAAQTAASSLQTTFFRTLAALLVAGLYFTLRGEKFTVPKASRWPLIFICLSSGVFGDLLYFTAISMTSAVNTSVLSHLQPIGIILLGTIWLGHEKLSLLDITGTALMIFSALIVTSRSFDDLLSFEFGNLGDLLILCATFFWSLSTVVTKYYVIGVSPAVIVVSRFTLSCLVFLPFILYRGEFLLNDLVPYALGLTTGVGLLLYFYALQNLKAAQTSSLELTATFFAAAFGYLFLGESVSWFQVLGILGLTLGVYLLSKHEEIENESLIPGTTDRESQP